MQYIQKYCLVIKNVCLPTKINRSVYKIVLQLNVVVFIILKLNYFLTYEINYNK